MNDDAPLKIMSSKHHGGEIDHLVIENSSNFVGKVFPIKTFRVNKQQQIKGDGNGEKWMESIFGFGVSDTHCVSFQGYETEYAPLRRTFSAEETLALERSFEERKYLRSDEASMLAFNLAIPKKKVFIVIHTM